MEGKKFSLNDVISTSITSFNGSCRKAFASSIIQYVAFLLTYLLTNSLLISFTVYAIFLPSQIKFLNNLKDAKIEDAFKIGKKVVPALLLAMLFVAIFGTGLVLLVVPGVLVFVNYALAFDYANENDIHDSFKKSKETLKGYRGQMLLMFLSFFLILILFVGFSILLSWLLSLIFPILTVQSTFIWSFVTTPMFYFVGAFVGVSAFLIFVLPVELVAISNMKGAIAQDKLYKEAKKEEEKKEEPLKEEKEFPKQDENKGPDGEIF